MGALRHGEQSFSLYGVNATLATLAAISMITLVLPNTTTSAPGPSYSTSQLILVAVAAIVLYGAFIAVQTARKRDYFLPPDALAEHTEDRAMPVSSLAAHISAILLIVCLGAVILLAKRFAPVSERRSTVFGLRKRSLG